MPSFSEFEWGFLAVLINNLRENVENFEGKLKNFK
jgi:hypothetical protein